MACRAVFRAGTPGGSGARYAYRSNGHSPAGVWPDARFASHSHFRHRARAVLRRTPGGGCALYRDGYPPATAADGHFKRRDAGHGGGGDAVHHPQWPGRSGAYWRERRLQRGGAAADFSVPGAGAGLASAGRDGRWSHYRAAGGGAGPRYLASAFYSDWDWRVMGFLCGNGDLYDHRRRARCADGDAVAGGEPARGKLDAGRYRRSLGGPGVCAAALYCPRG